MGLKIGVTGGIGSGKSVVTRLFQLLGAPTYDADQAAKNIMVDDESLRKELISSFGSDLYFADGTLNRSWLSKRVFNDQRELDKLNAIVHPAVIRRGEQWAAEQSGPYSVKEAALLFESGSYKALDYVILVSSPLAMRVERVVERDQTTPEAVMARVDKQLAEEEKIKRADFVIYNDERHSLIAQVYAIHSHFIHHPDKGK